jgi:hypothetical protein
MRLLFFMMIVLAAAGRRRSPSFEHHWSNFRATTASSEIRSKSRSSCLFPSTLPARVAEGSRNLRKDARPVSGAFCANLLRRLRDADIERVAQGAQQRSHNCVCV